MPPHVPVPRPGPCPGGKGGAGKVAKVAKTAKKAGKKALTPVTQKIARPKAVPKAPDTGKQTDMPTGTQTPAVPQPDKGPGKGSATGAKQAVKKVSARKLFAPESQKELKPLTDPAKLALLNDVFGTSHNGMTSSVKTVTANNNKVEVKGVIAGPDGSDIGEFQIDVRLDRRGGMFADLQLITIDPDFQGQGFAREFNNKWIGWARDSGMDRAQLLANIDVGALAWARAGWDWASPFDAQALQDRLREMAGGKDKNAARLASQMLDRFDKSEFGSPGYPTPYELSEMGRQDGQGKGDSWPGTVLFRSHKDPEHPDHLGWNAELPFKGKPAPVKAASDGARDGDRSQMVQRLVSAHDEWVGRQMDSTKFVARPDSKDFNLYYVDVDASGQAQDGLAEAMGEVIGSTVL